MKGLGQSWHSDDWDEDVAGLYRQVAWIASQ